MNKVQLIGHVGQDPETRTLQGGGKVTTFNVATAETWKDKKTGERKERTEWHRIVVFNPGLAGIAEKYVRKGSKVYVEGQLATRKWQDSQKQDRFTTEIVIKAYGGAIELLDRKPADAPETAHDDYEAYADETLNTAA